ncbi:hypothetical protein VTN02DRAFT_3106 [Thermoascus thermophilus]
MASDQILNSWSSQCLTTSLPSSKDFLGMRTMMAAWLCRSLWMKTGYLRNPIALSESMMANWAGVRASGGSCWDVWREEEAEMELVSSSASSMLLPSSNSGVVSSAGDMVFWLGDDDACRFRSGLFSPAVSPFEPSDRYSGSGAAWTFSNTSSTAFRTSCTIRGTRYPPKTTPVLPVSWSRMRCWLRRVWTTELTRNSTDPRARKIQMKIQKGSLVRMRTPWRVCLRSDASCLRFFSFSFSAASSSSDGRRCLSGSMTTGS